MVIGNLTVDDVSPFYLFIYFLVGSLVLSGGLVIFSFWVLW